MHSGEKIDFATSGATITDDTLRAIGRGGHIAIPTDSIAQLSVRKFSGRNTAGLLVGIGAVAFVVLLVVSIESLGEIN